MIVTLTLKAKDPNGPYTKFRLKMSDRVSERYIFSCVHSLFSTDFFWTRTTPMSTEQSATWHFIAILLIERVAVQVCPNVP